MQDPRIKRQCSCDVPQTSGQPTIPKENRRETAGGQEKKKMIHRIKKLSRNPVKITSEAQAWDVRASSGKTGAWLHTGNTKESDQSEAVESVIPEKRYVGCVVQTCCIRHRGDNGIKNYLLTG